MGNLLAKPITEKHTSTFETTHLRVGCCGMQGWRKTMEDAHVAQLNLDGAKDNAFFGVFDGHNGHKIAKYCGAHFLEELMNVKEYQKEDYVAAFMSAFENIDSKLENSPEYRNEGGTAAVCVLLINGTLYCAGAGDSRAVLSRANGVLQLSTDHKPTLPNEIKRIEQAGSCVQSGRVNGTLAVSRAIGDFDFKDKPSAPWKEQAVTALPDVTTTKLNNADGFLVIACDGIWDVLSNEKCCELITQELKNTNDDVGLVCEKVLDHCLAPQPAEIGSDNMAIIIVQFKPPMFSTASQ